MKKRMDFKQFVPDLLVIAAFIVISFAYFMPAVLEGRILMQHDSMAAIGQGQEQRQHMKQYNGDRTRWINSMFSGMPTYQMTPSYSSTDVLDTVKKTYSLFLPNYVFLLFIMLTGFYILMRAFSAPPLVSALGAVLWTLSSYFIILIGAGHIWKFITLAYIPPTLAGMILAYRKKYLAGGLLVMIFVAFQISSNHFQMSYYFLFLMFFIATALFVEAIREKRVSDFLKSSTVILIAALIGVAANASNLYHTYDYSKETMRGKSELSHHGAENKTDNGLERDYITAWSYGVDETWTLLVPNAKGGASVPLSENETAMKKALPQYRQLYQQIGQYWGEQPGTSGPVYVGAFVLTLFILGLFIVKGPIKWALLAGTLFSILLSWGKNFMPLTDFFIDYVPMYNKFRTVSSILVVAEFCIPLLAALTVKEIAQHPQKLKEHPQYLYIGLALTGGIALLFAAAPKIFFPDYISSAELQALQGFPPEQLQPLLRNLTDMRMAMFTADAWRSVLVVAIGALLLWLLMNNKLKPHYAVAGILALCLIDLWTVDKRYLNDSDFIEKNSAAQTFVKSQTDEIILQDTTQHYRVLNMATSTFNDGVTPYWHKAIGGYHAAKLRRYQDLIDVYLSKEMMAMQQAIFDTNGALDSVNADDFKVLNMLNTKWVIMPAQGGATVPLPNPYNQGNVWFVDTILFANNADEEIDALGNIDLRRQAVADKKFEPYLQGMRVTPRDSASFIELALYDSDTFIYKVNAKKPELAVFSEIYYPKGWQVTIDEKPVHMFRVNYTLRALPIPAGEHTIVFDFYPQSIEVTDNIANTALLTMLIIALLVLYNAYRNYKKQRIEQQKQIL